MTDDMSQVTLLLQGFSAEQQNDKVFATTLLLLRQQRDSNADMIVKLSVQLQTNKDQIAMLNNLIIKQNEQMNELLSRIANIVLKIDSTLLPNRNRGISNFARNVSIELKKLIENHPPDLE